MKLSTKVQQKSYENAKNVIFAKKNLKINMWKIRNIAKVEVIVIIQGVPKNIAVGFHNGSNYLYHYRCYHFSIKELAEKF